MFEPQKKIHRPNYVDQIKETYRDHPYMTQVNALKEQLKQEKIQDKAFCQAIKSQKSTHH